MLRTKQATLHRLCGRCAVAGIVVGTMLALTGGMAHAQWLQQFGKWQQERNQRYQKWRAPSQDGQGIRDVVDLFSGDAEPGNYNVRLPMGINLRMNVAEQRQEYPGDRAPHTIEAVVSLGSKIQQSLSFMHARARRFGSAELENRISEALSQIEQVLSTDITQSVSRFDATWHDLEEDLRSSDEIGRRFQGEIDQISDYDSRLHRIVSISPSHGYERMEALAVARRLEQQTGELVAELEYQVQPGAGLGRVMRNMRDTHQQAEDLYRAIRYGESYESVRTEYQQFDRLWHETVEMARTNQNVTRRMMQEHQEIGQLDSRLHDILHVESPLAQGKRTWVDKSRSAAKSANDLLQMIRGSNVRGDDELRSEAEDVAVATDDFYQWFEAGNRDQQEARQHISHIQRQWHDFGHRWSELPEGRYPQLTSLAQQVDQKVRQLVDRFAS